MIFYWLAKIFFGAFAKKFFQLKVEGLENLPRKGGFIIAANHASSLDPFIIIAAIPNYIRWLIVHEYYDKWYLRWMLKRMRFIRVENNLPKESFRALLKGEVIGIFPEGRRTWDGKFNQPKPGAAALARRTSHPLVPIGISGTFAAFPRTRRCPKLHPITVRIGLPLFFSESIDKEKQNQMDIENTARIMKAIAKLL